MVESVIRALISLCVLVLLAFLVLWGLGELGVIIPAMIVKVFWVIIALVGILILYKLFAPYVNGWFPPRR